MPRVADRIFFLIIAVAVFLFSVGSEAAGKPDKTVLELQKKYEAVNTLNARFIQEVSSKALGSVERSTGKIYLKKPGKMRWDYDGETAEKIISDGKRIWFVQTDLAQIVEADAGTGTTRVARDFLTGLGSIERDFSVEELKLDPADTAIKASFKLALLPKEKDPGIKRLVLLLDKDYLVRQTKVEDHFGNETRVLFEDAKLNEKFAESLFKLVVPKGFKVVKP